MKKPLDNKGMSLIELVITVAVISVVMLGSFQVFNEGLKLFKTNQAAAEGQAAALKVLGRLALEASNAKVDLIQHYPESGSDPPGLVFASPRGPLGPEFDSEGRLIWKTYICYYFDASENRVIRAERPVTPPSSDTAIVGAGMQSTTDFKNDTSLPKKTISGGLSGFNVEIYTGDITDGVDNAPTSIAYDVTVEAGIENQTGSDSYYIEVKSTLAPKG